jgi:hypothetical protein
MSVIQDEQRPGFKVRVQKVVLEGRERVSMRTVADRHLQLFGEMVLQESALRGAFYEPDNAFS